jgi:RNA polymerase sigma factor (sigma-70 family)
VSGRSPSARSRTASAVTFVSDNGEDPTRYPAEPAQAARVAQDDNPREIRAFHHKHGMKITRFIANLVSDAAAAQDIYQETWISFIRSDGLGPDTRTPAAVLMTIARRRVIDHYRKAAGGDECIGNEVVQRRQDESLRDRLADRLGSDRTTKVDLERALAELPAEYRHLLHLLFIDDLEPETVAAMLGKSRSTFYKMRNAALVQLRNSPHLKSYRPMTDQKEVQK